MLNVDTISFQVVASNRLVAQERRDPRERSVDSCGGEAHGHDVLLDFLELANGFFLFFVLVGGQL